MDFLANWLYWLFPQRVVALLRYGIVDVAPILWGAALIALIVLLFAWKRRRQLVCVLLALLLVFSLGWRPSDRTLARFCIDASTNRLVTPSEEFLHRIEQMETHSTLWWAGPSGQWNPLVDMALNRMVVPDKLYLEAHRFADANSYIDPWSKRERASKNIPLNRILVDNPLESGAARQVLNLETELLQSIEPARAAEAILYRLAGSQAYGRETVLGDALQSIDYSSAKPIDAEKPIPDDAALIVIDNPQQDIGQAFFDSLTAYMARGGKLLLFTDYTAPDMPHLFALTESMGARGLPDAVQDPESAVSGVPEYVVPKLDKDHPITRTLAAAYRSPMLPLAHGIEPASREGLTITPLLTTTDQAYMDAAGLTGPFNLAVACESGSARMVWIASTDMYLKNCDDDMGGANSALILASIRWLLGELVEPIPAKPLA